MDGWIKFGSGDKLGMEARGRERVEFRNQIQVPKIAKLQDKVEGTIKQQATQQTTCLAKFLVNDSSIIDIHHRISESIEKRRQLAWQCPA